MSVFYNSGVLEVLLRGKPTTDPNVKKKVEDAIDKSGVMPPGATGATVVQGELCTTIDFSELMCSDLEDHLNDISRDLSEFGITLDGDLEYFGNYDGYIANTDVGFVSMSKEQYGLHSAATEDIIDELEKRGFGVVKCANYSQAKLCCDETRRLVNREVAQEAMKAMNRRLKTKDEMAEEAANNKLEDSK